MLKQLALLILLLIVAFLGYESGMTGYAVFHPTEHESGPVPRSYMCSIENCSAAFAFEYRSSTSLDCAFFELDDPVVLEILNTTSSRVVLDADDKIDNPLFDVRYDDSSAYMHNKFCIDEKNRVWTGSWNPTQSAQDDRNNVVVLDSPSIAAEYRREFEELWQGTFHKGTPKKLDRVIYNEQPIRVAFCPEDNCQGVVLDTLRNANRSVYFMTFSFTDTRIAQELIRLHEKGVYVTGYFEPFLKRYSQFAVLNSSGVPVYLDADTGFLHHKVFIIDNTTVITGSYNPTSNGNTRNDENMIVISDPQTAHVYLDEFRRIHQANT